MKTKHKTVYAGIMLLGFILTAAFVADAFINTGNAPSFIKLPLIYYYTIQTNILAALWFLIAGLSCLFPAVKPPNANASIFATAYLLIAGLVFWVMLYPGLLADGHSVGAGNHWMHTVSPMLLLFGFLFMPQKRKTNSINLWLVLLYPAAYLTFVICIFCATGQSVYPFLDPINAGGMGRLAIVLGLLTGLLVALTALLYISYNASYKRQQKSQSFAHTPS